MTDQQHPITPPPELVQQWLREEAEGGIFAEHFATQAARWGSDQELEACCAAEHTVYGKGKADWLRSLRRPKPPSLKEQALNLMQKPKGSTPNQWLCLRFEEADTIRRALEQLND